MLWVWLCDWNDYELLLPSLLLASASVITYKTCLAFPIWCFLHSPWQPRRGSGNVLRTHYVNQVGAHLRPVPSAMACALCHLLRPSLSCLRKLPGPRVPCGFLGKEESGFCCLLTLPCFFFEASRIEPEPLYWVPSPALS